MPTTQWIEREIERAVISVTQMNDPAAIKRELMLIKMARIALQSRRDAIKFEIAFNVLSDQRSGRDSDMERFSW